MTGYRMIVVPYDLHYHLSTRLCRCYLLGRPEQLVSESRAGLIDKHDFHDTEAISQAMKTTKIIASRYESDLESLYHRLLTQTCPCSRESRVSDLVEEDVDEILVIFLR